MITYLIFALSFFCIALSVMFQCILAKTGKTFAMVLSLIFALAPLAMAAIGLYLQAIK